MVRAKAWLKEEEEPDEWTLEVVHEVPTLEEPPEFTQCLHRVRRKFIWIMYRSSIIHNFINRIDMKNIIYTLLLVIIVKFEPSAFCADWPVWGGNGSRNMVSSETKLALEFDPGEMGDNEKVNLSSTKNVKWVAKLGSQAYGNVNYWERICLCGYQQRVPQRSQEKRIVAWFSAWMRKLVI